MLARKASTRFRKDMPAAQGFAWSYAITGISESLNISLDDVKRIAGLDAVKGSEHLHSLAIEGCEKAPTRLLQTLSASKTANLAVYYILKGIWKYNSG